MTATELLQVAAGGLFGLAIWMMLSERRIVRRLRTLGATSAGSAAPVRAETPVARFRLSRLLRSGAVVQTGRGLYYLNPGAYERFRDARRKRVLMVMVITLLLLTLLRRTVRW